MSFFEPPIGKSTFYDLVQQGVVVQVPAPRGYYKLNTSLARLGLKGVSAIPRAGGVGPVEVTALALWMAAPDLCPCPPWMLDLEPTQDQSRTATAQAEIFRRELGSLESVAEKREFIQGVLDMAYLIGRENP